MGSASLIDSFWGQRTHPNHDHSACISSLFPCPSMTAGLLRTRRLKWCPATRETWLFNIGRVYSRGHHCKDQLGGSLKNGGGLCVSQRQAGRKPTISGDHFEKRPRDSIRIGVEQLARHEATEWQTATYKQQASDEGEMNKTWCQNRVSREIDEHCHVYLVSENGPWPVNHPKTGGKSNQGMLRKTIPLSCASSSPSRQVQHFRLEDKYSIFGGLLEKLDGPGCLGHNTHLKQSLNLCLIKLTFQTNAYAPQVLAQKATTQKGDLTWSRHSPKEPSVDSALRETTNGIHPNPGALLHRSVNSTLTKSLRGWKGPCT